MSAQEGSRFLSSGGSATNYPGDPYRVRLYRGEKLLFKGWLPENFTFTLDSQWDTPLANTINDAIGPMASSISYTGLTPRHKAVTYQAWQGSSPVAFNLSIHLKAEDDARADVVERVRRLGQLVLPGEIGTGALGFYTAPASIGASVIQGIEQSTGVSLGVPLPSGSDGTQGQGEGAGDRAIGALRQMENAVTQRGFFKLIIGQNFMVIDDVIVKTVSPNFYVRMDRTHKVPIEAEVDVTFETAFTPSRNDFNKWFRGGGA